MRAPTRSRPLRELHPDAAGQLATEWALLTATVVIPILLCVPMMLGMIQIYFYRIAEVICLPFP